MSAFASLFFLKRNERIRKKLTHITRLKGVPTDYYQVENIIERDVRVLFFYR